VQVTIKTNLKKLEKLSGYYTLLGEATKKIGEFFQIKSESLPAEMEGFKCFFRTLHDDCSLAEPEARIGFCSSKDEFYLSYKVHLVISKKNGSILTFKITPANVRDSQVLIF